MRNSNLALFAAAGIAGVALAALAVKPRREVLGKLVLITGGSRGLGLVLATQLSQRGARVAICARDQEELGRARQLIESRGGRVMTHVCDVTKEDQVSALVRELEQTAGPVDILINNAGIITMGPVHEMSKADFQESLDIYFWAPLHATLAVLPSMRKRRTGQIINVSSIGGKVPVPHLTPYCAGKFALTGLSGCLRAELARDGIGVSTICPFVMRTGSQVNGYFKGRHRAEFAWFMLAGSSAPFSVPVERAAARIIRGIENDEAEVMVGIEAKLAARLYGLAPGFTSCLTKALNRVLPREGGIGEGYRRGLESRTWVATLLPTKPIYRAAIQNNQVSGERREIVEDVISSNSKPRRKITPKGAQGA